MTDPQRDYPHAEAAQFAPSFAPDMGNMEAFDLFLRGRLETDVKFVTAVFHWLMSQPQGRTLVLGVLTADDSYIRRIVRQEVAAAPVQPHTHKAKSVMLTTLARSMSWVGAVIGGLLGALIGWLIISNYTITTITFGDDQTAVAYVKAAIVAVTVLIGAITGAIVGGRRKERQHTIDVALESETITRPVPDTANAAQG